MPVKTGAISSSTIPPPPPNSTTQKSPPRLKAHNIENLLTFNAKDFKRYPDIEAVELKKV